MSGRLVVRKKMHSARLPSRPSRPSARAATRRGGCGGARRR
jgi:hypothetical protein